MNVMRRAALAMLSMAWLCYSIPAQGADVTATWNGGFGDWSDATKWSSDPDIPNNDGVTTYDVVISSSTVLSDVAGGVTIDGLTLNGGSLGGTESVTVLASGNWSSQGLRESAELILASSAEFDISGNGLQELRDQSSLTVAGTVNHTGTGSLRSAGNAADVLIDVQSGGIFDIQSDADLIGEFGENSSFPRQGTLSIAGTLQKSAGDGLSKVDANWDVTNTGSILVQAGTLQFGSSTANLGNGFNNNGTADAAAGRLRIGIGTSTGSFHVQPEAILEITTSASGMQTIDGGSITNNGTLEFNGNSNFIDGAALTGTGEVHILSGNLAGDTGSPLTLSNVTWSGGTIRHAGEITLGTLAIEGSGNKRLENNAQIILGGTATVTGTKDIDAISSSGPAAQWTVAAGGVLDLQTDVGFGSGSLDADAAQLNIAGTLRKSAATGVSTIEDNWQVTNTGTIEVHSGSLDIESSVAQQGTIDLAGGDIRFAGDVTGAGNFTGTGTATFAANYAPGASPAEIDFAGDVVFTSGAELAIELGGSENAGIDFDVLDIEGTATLAGTLDVTLINAFEPLAGDTFEIMSSAGGLGETTFDTQILPELTDANWIWEVLYDTNILTLAVIDTTPVFAAADFNEDGFVDADDLDIWRSNYGLVGTATTATGDANLDNIVDGRDFLLWQNQFTGPPPSASLSVASVPEPTGSVLVGLLVLSFVGVGRVRCAVSIERQARYPSN